MFIKDDRKKEEKELLILLALFSFDLKKEIEVYGVYCMCSGRVLG